MIPVRALIILYPDHCMDLLYMVYLLGWDFAHESIAAALRNVSPGAAACVDSGHAFPPGRLLSTRNKSEVKAAIKTPITTEENNSKDIGCYTLKRC